MANILIFGLVNIHLDKDNMKTRFNKFGGSGEFDNFDRKFNSIFNISRGIIGISAAITILILIASIFLGIQVISNPESVGQFFGKIIHGFNSTK